GVPVEGGAVVVGVEVIDDVDGELGEVAECQVLRRVHAAGQAAGLRRGGGACHGAEPGEDVLGELLASLDGLLRQGELCGRGELPIVGGVRGGEVGELPVEVQPAELGGEGAPGQLVEIRRAGGGGRRQRADARVVGQDKVGRGREGDRLGR